MQRLYVLNMLLLGNRELGYEFYSQDDGIIEMTTKQIINAIKKGEDKILGLKLSADETILELDEKFYTTNIMCKRHIANYRPLIGHAISNFFCIVLRKRIEKGATVYEVITTKFLTLTLDEETVKSYIRLGIISGGAKLENDIIVIPSDEPKLTPMQDVKQDVKEDTKSKAEKK